MNYTTETREDKLRDAERGLAGEKYASKFFANGATPGGVLTYPQKLTKEQEESLRRAWAQAYGDENRFRTAILQLQEEKIKSW